MTATDDEMEFGPFRLDLRRRQLSRGGKAVPLGSRALDLLCALAAARGDLVPKDRLMAELWPGIAVEEHNLYVHVSTLRKALEDEENERAHLITVPGRGYRLVGTRSRADSRPSEAGEGLPLPDRPSIAVLPFQNMSGDPEQDYFADGIVEEITTALSRFRHLFVIASNSGFAYKGRAVDVKQVGRELGVRYLLEGSVRRAANRVRITGKLIDAANGAHLWADRFEADLDDVFGLQDRVTASVVGAIPPRLETAEIERVKRKPTGRLDAYDHYLRGAAIAGHMSRDASDEALRRLYKALELDPDFAMVYARAAECYAFRKGNGWMTGRAEEIAEAARVGRRAAEVGNDDALALAYGGFVLAYVAGELDEGAALVDRALSLNLNSADAWAASGWMKLCLGEPAAATDRLAVAIRLSPLDPLLFVWQSFMALAHIFAGRGDAAVLWIERSLREQPDYPGALRIAAVANALVGRVEEAHKAMARVRQLDPALRASNLEALLPPLRRAEDRRTFVNGLLEAGLPE